MTRTKGKAACGQGDEQQHKRGRWSSYAKQLLNRLTPTKETAKIVAPPVVAVFIVSALVLVRPISIHGMGKFSFLCIAYLHLFFYPSPDTIGEHIETVVLSVLGSAFGLALSFLAVAGTVWIDKGAPPYSSPGSRALGALSLTAICFFGGLLSSLTPRLKTSVRIALFNSTWAITTGATAIESQTFTQLFYPTLLTAGVSMLCNATIFPRTGFKAFTNLLGSHLDTTCQILEQSADDFFGARASSRTASEQLLALRKKLLQADSRLAPAFNGAMHELTYRRLHVSSYASLLPLAHNLRSWVACGMGLKEPDSPGFDEDSKAVGAVSEEASEESKGDRQPGGHSIMVFEPAVRALLKDTTESLRLVRAVVEMTESGSARGTLLECVSAARRPSDLAAPEKPSARVRLSRWWAHFGGTPQSESGTADRILIVAEQRRKLADSAHTFRESLHTALVQLRPPPQATDVPEPVSPVGTGFARNRMPQDVLRSPQEILFSADFYSVSFLMTALLEISHEASAALRVSQSHLSVWHAHRRRRIWLPSVLSWRAWLSVSGSGVINNLVGNTSGRFGDVDETSASRGWEGDETRKEEPEEARRWDEVFGKQSRPSAKSGDSSSQRSVSEAALDQRRHVTLVEALDDPAGFVHTMSRRPAVLRARLRLSHAITATRRSRHLKFAIKLGAGVALLSLPAWLPGAGHNWWDTDRGQWLLITYIWCLETSTGATIRVSLFRIAGTLFGGLLGLLAWTISRGSPYALAPLLALAAIPAALFMLRTTAPGLGAVIGITYPVVCLIPYLGEEYKSVPLLAATRMYQILLGIVAALFVNLLFFPYHARVQLVRQVGRATGELQSLYLSLARQMLQAGFVPSGETRASFDDLERKVQTRLNHARGLLALMRSEVSLIPKATPTLAAIVEQLQNIADLLSTLRRTRDRGLRAVRQEAVLNVLDLRRDLVSAIVISLWVVGSSLTTSAPLPQFLPSPRLALDDFTLALKEQLGRMDRQHRQHQHVQQKPSRARLVKPKSYKGSLHSPSASQDLPDAYHALDSLVSRTQTIGWRQRHSFCPVELPSTPRTPIDVRRVQGFSTDAASPGGADEPHAEHMFKDPLAASRHISHAHFFIWAEHEILSDMIQEIETLLRLTRDMVGEATFLTTHFVPQPSSGHASGGNTLTGGGSGTWASKMERGNLPTAFRQDHRRAAPA